MKTILIADECAEHRTCLSSALRQWGYRVFVSGAGSEARNFIQTTSPDVLVTALTLADMSGFELCSQIRQAPTLYDRPVILLAPVLDDKIRVAGARAQVTGYLHWPVILGELSERLHYYAWNFRDISSQQLAFG